MEGTNSKHGKIQRPKIDDPNLSTLAESSQRFNYSAQIQRDFNSLVSSKNMSNPLLDYDNMEINQHIFDLWIVLRRIVKIVFLTTLIILVLPGYSKGTLLLDPYKPLILQLLNSLISYSLLSLSKGGEISVFIGSPLAPISLYLNLGAFVAIIVSLPITMKELMSFVRPGLTVKEWEILIKLSKVSVFLFLLGSSISFFIILPVTLRILATSGGIVGEGALLQMYSLDSVLSLLLWGTLGGGILYASPVVLIALVNLDVLTADQIAKRKREMIFLIFLVAAFVTPDPTIVSMVILSLPMIVIIEFIINIAYKIELEKMIEGLL